MGDYWGLANSVAMIVSVIVRWVLVKENLLGLDDAAQTATASEHGKEPKLPSRSNY